MPLISGIDGTRVYVTQQTDGIRVETDETCLALIGNDGKLHLYANVYDSTFVFKLDKAGRLEVVKDL